MSRDPNCMFCGVDQSAVGFDADLDHKLQCAKYRDWYRKGVEIATEAAKEALVDAPQAQDNRQAAEASAQWLEAQVAIRVPGLTEAA